VYFKFNRGFKFRDSVAYCRALMALMGNAVRCLQIMKNSCSPVCLHWRCCWKCMGWEYELTFVPLSTSLTLL